MLNEQKKSNNNRNIYAAVSVVVFLAIIGCAVRGCGSDATPSKLHQCTDSTVGAIEAEHTVIGRELDAAGGQLDSAGAALGRADELVTASQERVAENANSLADCQRIVSECRKIVADSQRVYAEVEKANRAGAESSSGS